MNSKLDRDALEGFSVGLAVSLHAQRLWADILSRAIVTKAVIPAAGYYPDFALPDLQVIAELRQDYIADVSQALADLTRQPVLAKEWRGLLEELLLDPTTLLAHSYVDLDRWENRARGRLDDLRKLNGKLEEAIEPEFVEPEEHE
jgi:hypothetical protein